jgi:hypothetical protein
MDAYRQPLDAAEKAKAFAEGQYVFMVPPVCRAAWGPDAWIAYIDANKGWRIPVAPAPTPDVTFTNHGSVVIVRAISEMAKGWVADFIPDGAMGWGDGFVVEPRYVADILEGMIQDGLLIEEA